MAMLNPKTWCLEMPTITVLFEIPIRSFKDFEDRFLEGKKRLYFKMHNKHIQ